MTTNNPQVPWTDEQWARVNQVIQEEATRARVAATFLPLYGPLSADTDFVRAEIIPPDAPLRIQDRNTIQLATLQVRVPVRSAQMADPDMRSVLAVFRRAANVLARLEDAVVFRGLEQTNATSIGFAPPGGTASLPAIWEIHGGQATPGLWGPRPTNATWQWIEVSAVGEALVTAVSDAIGKLEGHGHFGPFAAVLGQGLFLVAQTPDQSSLVLPQDRIIPFLGGGSLLRSSTLDEHKGYSGVVVALGGAPVELVVATDVSLQFLQVTEHPNFLFRVREKIALRIKEADAIIRLYVPPPTVTRLSQNRGPAAGSTADHPINIDIEGTNFLGATRVEFDGSAVTSFKILSDTQITVPLPAHAVGEVHAKVTTPGGTSDETAGNLFTYVGGQGPRRGGQG
jgi:uncharacterized linocin/CFP29 family protein